MKPLLLIFTLFISASSFVQALVRIALRAFQHLTHVSVMHPTRLVQCFPALAFIPCFQFVFREN
jgi:hypothetical protein